MTPFVRYVWTYAVHRRGRLLTTGQVVFYEDKARLALRGATAFLHRLKPELLVDADTGVTILERGSWEDYKPNQTLPGT